MNTLYKQDGTKMEVNNNSLDFALKLGWTKETPAETPAETPTKKPASKAAKKAN